VLLAGGEERHDLVGERLAFAPGSYSWISTAKY
jgi:hypothetical protein